MEKEKKRNKNVTFTGNSQTINGPSTITLEDIKRNQNKDETPVGTGVSSWNDFTDKPFEETTVTKEAITWDGNTEGLYGVVDMFYNVSNAIPTLEDLQQGGSVTFDGNEIPFTSDNIMDMGALGEGSDCYLVLSGDVGATLAVGIVLKEGATATAQGMTVTFEKTGIYFLNNSQVGKYTSSFTINNYTFTEAEIKTIDPKYLPNDLSGGAGSVLFRLDTTTTKSSMTSTEIVEALQSGAFVYGIAGTDTEFAICNVVGVTTDGNGYTVLVRVATQQGEQAYGIFANGYYSPLS